MDIVNFKILYQNLFELKTHHVLLGADFFSNVKKLTKASNDLTSNFQALKAAMKIFGQDHEVGSAVHATQYYNTEMEDWKKGKTDFLAQLRDMNIKMSRYFASSKLMLEQFINIEVFKQKPVFTKESLNSRLNELPGEYKHTEMRTKIVDSIGKLHPTY